MSSYRLIIFLATQIISEINIHVIPHTHLDPGWGMTTEEYYKQNNVQGIFDVVLKELSNTAVTQKTFVINEIYYFKIWYENLSEDKKSKFKDLLLKEKRIEFVGGGYVTNDEATPLYYDIIDQMRIGHQYLLEEFGIIPKTGWYIDSFGHSIGNAYILSELNFENLVIGRMHDDFLELMRKEKKLEFNWELFGNPKKEIFTHVLSFDYGFILDSVLGSPHENLSQNIRQIVDKLIDRFNSISSGIKHKNILLLYGGDFNYKDNSNFLNIDNLIKNVFQNPSSEILKYMKEKLGENINFFYSTPEKYISTVKKELEEKNIEISTFSNIDFFPLRHECYWTGYFNSRPCLKGIIRKGSNIFYSLSKYYSFNQFLLENITDNTTSNLNYLREIVGLNLHHDAITGTSMQYVSTDFIEKVRKAIKKVENDFKENFEEKYKFKIEKICYNNYIVDDNGCSSDFFIENNNDELIRIGLFNPLSDSDSNNNLLINIEILSSEYEYEIIGINSDFICINENNIQDN